MIMGKEVIVTSLDDMCSLMCDNQLPTSQHIYCLRCGRKLRSAESKERGYGKSCEKKMQKESKLTLF